MKKLLVRNLELTLARLIARDKKYRLNSENN
jgi:hypothetical protein